MSESSVFYIDHSSFQGPIELLYKLICQHQLDVSEVSLGYITDEYLEYVEKYKDNITENNRCSFLEIASHLLLLKSKKMLPFLEDAEESLENTEFTDSLLDRIMFFSRLEPGIEFLKERFVAWNYVRFDSDIKSSLDLEYSISPLTLHVLAEKTAVWLSEKVKHSLSMGEIKPLYLGIEERWHWIINEAREYNKEYIFNNIIRALPVIDKIISFLALLEKLKIGHAKAEQRDLFKDIIMEKIYAK